MITYILLGISLVFIILCNPFVRKFRMFLSPFYYAFRFKLIIRLYRVRYLLFLLCLILVLIQHAPPISVNFSQIKPNISILEQNLKLKSTTLISATSTHDISSLFSEDGFVFPESNTAYLTDSDITELQIRISNQSLYDLNTMLSFARNEIYARHGHKFKSSFFSNHYSKFEWYLSQSLHHVDWSEFNEYETFNIKFIQTYEK